MPRRSSGGRSSRASARAPVRNPPAPVNHAPPPAPVQGGNGGSMLGRIGSTIADGMAFGTGSAVAHRAVDAIVGPRTIQHENVGTAAPQAAPALPQHLSLMPVARIPRHSKIALTALEVTSASANSTWIC